eukprot:m.82222 g.82222  ORF g.82222 m.82222 type:complete len:212 (-) comp9453_c0_seq2:247-882(-)
MTKAAGTRGKQRQAATSTSSRSTGKSGAARIGRSDAGKMRSRSSTARSTTASDAPLEVSSKVAPSDLPEAPEPTKKRRRVRRKLDEDVLAAITTADLDPEDDSVPTPAPETRKIRSKFRGKRVVLDAEGRHDQVVRRAPAPAQRVVDGGVVAKHLRPTPTASTTGRAVPKKVNKFLKEHFYGDRLRRTEGPANRRRGFRPARSFAVKSPRS